jgi:chemosensory pili system protein ChpA (sensor histidine kinase/response regulator)
MKVRLVAAHLLHYLRYTYVLVEESLASYNATQPMNRYAMKILFVDDAPDTRSLFSVAFRLEGHRTRLAADGVEAVQAVQDEPFDAIVMDVEMPRMDGWEATRQIRGMPHGRDVPILVFTGYNHEDDIDKAAEVGANALVRKPLLPQTVLSHLAQLKSV